MLDSMLDFIKAILEIIGVGVCIGLAWGVALDVRDWIHKPIPSVQINNIFNNSDINNPTSNE